MQPRGENIYINSQTLTLSVTPAAATYRIVSVAVRDCPSVRQARPRPPRELPRQILPLLPTGLSLELPTVSACLLET
jgi:hypothetical protein